jgi:hypothetical protein
MMSDNATKLSESVQPRPLSIPRITMAPRPTNVDVVDGTPLHRMTPTGISCSKNDALKRGNDTGGPATDLKIQIWGFPRNKRPRADLCQRCLQQGDDGRGCHHRWLRPNRNPVVTGQPLPHPSSICLKRIRCRPPRRHRGVKDVAPWCLAAPRPSPRSRPAAAITGRGST